MFFYSIWYIVFCQKMFIEMLLLPGNNNCENIKYSNSVWNRDSRPFTRASFCPRYYDQPLLNYTSNWSLWKTTVEFLLPIYPGKAKTWWSWPTFICFNSYYLLFFSIFVMVNEAQIWLFWLNVSIYLLLNWNENRNTKPFLDSHYNHHINSMMIYHQYFLYISYFIFSSNSFLWKVKFESNWQKTIITLFSNLNLY